MDSLSIKMNRHSETDVKPKTQRATTISDKAMHGILSRRLDATLDHYPGRATGNIRCGIHRWVGVETERNVAYCPAYNVILCIAYSSGFHHVKDIVRDKDKLKRKYKP